MRIRLSARTFRPAFGHGTVFCFGTLLGLLLWHVAGVVNGDGLFHEGRVRKLLDLPHLHLRSVDELAGGGLHPGLRVPALARVPGARGPGLRARSLGGRESRGLAARPACLRARLGVRRRRLRIRGRRDLGHRSPLSRSSASPRGTAGRTYRSPCRRPRRGSSSCPPCSRSSSASSTRGAGPISLRSPRPSGHWRLIHPTYALFVLIPARRLYGAQAAPSGGRSVAALGAALVPSALVVLWLRPLVDETLSHNPDAADAARLARPLRRRAGRRARSTTSASRPRCPAEPERLPSPRLRSCRWRGLAVRRRWGAFVLGGTVAVLALMLVPELFVRFSNAVSLSQARRAAGFAPLPFAFAGGLALLARSVVALPARARGRDRARAALARRLRLRAPSRRPGGRDVVRARRRRGGPRRGARRDAKAGRAAARGALRPRRLDRRTVRPAGRRPRLRALVARRRSAQRPVRAHACAPPRASAGACGLGRDRRPRDRLRARGRGAGLRRGRARRPRCEHEGERSGEARGRGRHWLATGDPSIPRRYGATWAVEHGRLIRLPT